MQNDHNKYIALINQVCCRSPQSLPVVWQRLTASHRHQVILGKPPLMQAEDEPAKLSSKYNFAEMQFFYHVVRPTFQHLSRTSVYSGTASCPFKLHTCLCQRGWSAATVHPDNKAAQAARAVLVAQNQTVSCLLAYMHVQFACKHSASAGKARSCGQRLP